MDKNRNLTRTAETEATYLQIALRLQERFLRQRASETATNTLPDSLLDPDAPLPDESAIAAEDAATLHTFTEFVQWFRGLCSQWRPATINLRRAAITFWINHEFERLPPDIEAAHRQAVEQDVQSAKALLQEIPLPRKRDIAPRTSAKKRKSIPLPILKQISLHLQRPLRANSVWDIRALRFLLAGIVSGLRPIEWQTVQVADADDGSLTLLVQNAKATNGRGTGPTRTVTIPPGIDRTIVEEHLYELEQFAQKNPDRPFSQYIENTRFALWAANRALFPASQAHVTLYTGRHQFSANKKAEGLTKRELADLMGHESEDTAGAHYGRRKSGWGRKPGTDRNHVLNAARPGSR